YADAHIRGLHWRCAMFIRRVIRSIVSGLVLATAALTLPVHAARPCPPDTNCSGSVNIDDLLAVIGHWGPCSSCPWDVNGDSTVNIDDLLAVIAAWGLCQFDFGTPYSNTEAHQIGLEMLGAAGPLTLSQTLYDRIVRDLGLIRAAYPALASQTHSPAWVPNQLIVGVPIDPPHTEFQCRNV